MPVEFSRYLAVHLPAFRLERCGYLANDLAGLIAEQKNAMRLISLTPAAQKAGLQLGMSVGQARSLIPELQVELHDPLGESRDRAELLHAFEQISDTLRPLGEQDLVAEITHTARVFGGELALLNRTLALAQDLGHEAQVAITDDPLGAIGLASTCRRSRILPPGEMAAGLAHLPLSALHASTELDAALRSVGIRTLGQLATLDPASIRDRFGPEGMQLHQIACGTTSHSAENTLAWSCDDVPRVSAYLGGVTTTLQLHFVLPGLLGQLTQALASRDLAVVQLHCSLRLERGSPVSFGVRVGRPTRNRATLERLIRARLASVRLQAPVEEWVIEVRDAVPEQGWQPGLTDRSESSEPLPDVLARLRDALGPSAVFAAEPLPRWSPERSWRAVPVPMNPAPRRPPSLADDPVARQERWEDALPVVRPTQLLPQPSPIQVRLQGLAPAHLLLEGRWQRVLSSRGPEQLSGDWWRPELAWQRTYWSVQLPTQAAWIFRSTDQWFLHGWF